MYFSISFSLPSFCQPALFQPIWLCRQMDRLNTVSCMLYRNSSDRQGLYCSLHPLVICFFWMSSTLTLCTSSYIMCILYYECVSFPIICIIQKIFCDFHSKMFWDKIIGNYIYITLTDMIDCKAYK